MIQTQSTYKKLGHVKQCKSTLGLTTYRYVNTTQPPNMNVSPDHNYILFNILKQPRNVLIFKQRSDKLDKRRGRHARGNNKKFCLDFETRKDDRFTKQPQERTIKIVAECTILKLLIYHQIFKLSASTQCLRISVQKNHPQKQTQDINYEGIYIFFYSLFFWLDHCFYNSS